MVAHVALLLASDVVVAGTLIESDVAAATSALVELIGREAKGYTFEATESGCVFSSCSTELVRFARHARFVKVVSEPNAPIQRKKFVHCWSSETDTRRWQCGTDTPVLARVLEGDYPDLRVPPQLSDESIIGVLKYMRSDCFVAQSAQYERDHKALPAWARSNVKVGSISLVEDGIRASIKGDRAYSGGTYSLTRDTDNVECGYSIRSFSEFRIYI